MDLQNQKSPPDPGLPAPNLVPRFILEQHWAGKDRGAFPAAALFVDISGFTPLTETLFRYRHDGAAVLSETLDEIFGPIVGRVYEAGGLIPLYAGDAFTAVFPRHERSLTEAVHRAWQVALFIRRFFFPQGQPRQFRTTHGTFAVAARAGLAVGEVQWGIPGRPGRYSFYFRGPAIDGCATAQKQAAAGQIVATADFAARLDIETVSLTQTEPGFVGLPSSGPLSPASPMPAKAPAAPPAELQLLQQLFVDNTVSDLALKAELREICPVFISFRRAGDTDSLHRWIALVMEQSQQYGGTFSQIDFGDKGGVMVLWFGAPVSYENNAGRAAAFLLALQNSQYGGADPPSLQWRASFTYGLVWAGIRGAPPRFEYGAAGDVVNVASRISLEADWGQIWLDEAAAGQLAGGYRVQPLGQFIMKGKRHPSPLFRLLAAQEKLDVMYRGQMVGRQMEMSALQTSVAPIFEDEFAGLTYVYGQAGMGKSRLLFELQQQLGSRVSWLRCPADDISRSSLHPFRRLLRDFFHISAEAESAQNRAVFDTVLADLLQRLETEPDPRAERLGKELWRTRSLLAALLDIFWPDSLFADLDSELRFNNTLLALRTFFQALALQGPILIHLEDAHWLDEDSRQLTAGLARHLRHFPAAIVFASRFADDGSRPALEGLREAIPQTIIELYTLTPQDIQLLAEQLLRHPVDRDVVYLLTAKSNGTPFFAEQLVLDLREREALVIARQQGTKNVYSLAEGASTGLPTSLNSLLITRLDRLDPAVKQVVQTAAILGERFSIPVLSAMLYQDDRLAAKLEIGVEKQIWAMQDELRYLFRHALLREAAYGMQLRSHRRSLHLLAAETLEKLYTSDLAAHYEEITHHYEAAFRQGLTHVRDNAGRYLALAGRQAAEKYENLSALDYFNRALNLAEEEDDTRRWELLLQREALWHVTGQRRAQLADLQALDEIARRSARADWQTQLALRHAEYASAISSYILAVEQAKKAVSLAQSSHLPGLLVEGYIHWARASIWRRDHAQALEPLDKARQLARKIERPDLEAEVLRDLGYVASQMGDNRRAEQTTAQALAICRQIGHRRGEAANIGNLGGFYLDQGDYLRALRNFEEALLIYEEMGSFWSQGIIINNIGITYWRLGDYEPARDYINRARRIYQEVKNRQLLSHVFYYLGLTMGRLKAPRQGTALLNRSLQLAREVNSRAAEADAYHGLGELALAMGELDAAKTSLIRSREMRHQLGADSLAVEATAALARLAMLRFEKPPHREQNLHLARQYVAQILDYLDSGRSLSGVEEPLRIYWICYRVLQAAGDRRAEQMLLLCRQKMAQQMALLTDSAARRRFLNAVPDYNQILRATGLSFASQPDA